MITCRNANAGDRAAYPSETDTCAPTCRARWILYLSGAAPIRDGLRTRDLAASEAAPR